jgi:hypothetical protein
MNKSEVKMLFADCLLLNESNELARLDLATKWYNTNGEYASWVLYRPQRILPFEYCKIYFDTNNIIVAQFYNPPGHRAPHASPPPVMLIDTNSQ